MPCSLAQEDERKGRVGREAAEESGMHVCMVGSRLGTECIPAHHLSARPYLLVQSPCQPQRLRVDLRIVTEGRG